MRANTTKQKLAAGKVVFGGIVMGYSPEMVEMLGLIGYDFVFLDCEHGPMSWDQVENMVRAAEVFGITPIARVPDQQDATILRYLDRGVQGVIVPHVNTREQAERVAAACRYYPEDTVAPPAAAGTTTMCMPGVLRRWPGRTPIPW